MKFTTTVKVKKYSTHTFMKIKQESSGVPKHCLDDKGDILTKNYKSM